MDDGDEALVVIGGNCDPAYPARDEIFDHFHLQCDIESGRRIDLRDDAVFFRRRLETAIDRFEVGMNPLGNHDECRRAGRGRRRRLLPVADTEACFGRNEENSEESEEDLFHRKNPCRIQANRDGVE